MFCPHATMEGETLHLGVHTQAPFVHVWPVGQSVPAPGHVWFGHTFTSGRPHMMLEAAGQLGMHSQRELVHR